MIERLKQLLYSRQSVDNAAHKVNDDTSKRLALVAKSIQRQVEKDFANTKQGQWQGFLESWARLHRGSGYLPKHVSDALESIHCSIMREAQEMEAYFDKKSFSSPQNRAACRKWYRAHKKKKTNQKENA